MKFPYSYSNMRVALIFSIVISFYIKAQTQFTTYDTSQFLPDDYLTENLADEDSLIDDEKKDIGIWFQLGIGSTRPNLNYGFNPSSFTHLALSLNVRLSKSLISLGIDKASTTCCWEINTYWGGYGIALSSNYLDVSVSAGPSISTWQYDTETESGKINSPSSIGVIIKAQILPHLPIGLGLGIVFTYNASKEVDYTSISFVLAFGGWSG